MSQVGAVPPAGTVAGMNLYDRWKVAFGEVLVVQCQLVGVDAVREVAEAAA